MPSVRLSDKEMWQIVAYVRSLSRRRGPVAGDSVAGRQVYEGTACVQCHWIDGQGGRLGPELTSVGWRRSAMHLRASILDPDDDIDAGYRQVTVRVRGGGGGQGGQRREGERCRGECLADHEVSPSVCAARGATASLWNLVRLAP